MATASCGAGSGTSSDLPPGPTTTAPPGNIVLYVTMAQGDRVDAYRLGTDGLLPAAPFSTMHLTNPRRLTINDGILYVATEDRIVSARLGQDGALPVGPDAQTDVREDSVPLDLIVRNGILYAAITGYGLVESFELQDGMVPADPTGVGTGQYPADYVSLELSGGYLYAGSRRSQLIDVFLLDADGNVPDDAEAQDPIDAISLPDDMEIRDNILYVTSAGDRAIRAYRILADGTLPAEQDSRTKAAQYYSSIVLDGTTLYASAYNAGRIDLFTVADDGMLPEEPPFASTKDDPSSYPARMVLRGGILYVAQAGLDRVDAYVIGPDKLPPEYPSSSTVLAPGDSFPSDIVAYELN
ncbi:MAG: hypothetical protein HY899_05080 [Deltaproteobacteria bacterium]|nr:hypothetical protein [Deltaproteobacteria bacterium]